MSVLRRRRHGEAPFRPPRGRTRRPNSLSETGSTSQTSIQDQMPSHRPPTGLFGATRVGELKVGRSSYLISCGLLVGKEPDLDPGPAEWVEHTKDPRVWRRGAAWSRTGPFSADPGASARCEPSAASKFAVPSKGDRWVPWIRTLILRRFRPTTRAGWCFPGCNLELWV
jgi:hypothetical protein